MKHGRACLCGLLCALMMLSGCSIRTRRVSSEAANRAAAWEGHNGAAEAGERTDAAGNAPPEGQSGEEKDALSDEPDPNAPSVEDAGAERREYRPHADAELVEGDAGKLFAAEQDASGDAPEAGEKAETLGGRETDGAELTATELLAQQEAEQLGISEEAPRAEDVYQYYQTLLKERVGALFECKRLYVYWETSVDYQTVFRDSPAHDVIRAAGGYDVAAKRQADALTVDDGWVARKAPGCIVKGVEPAVLGEGVISTREARRIWEEIGSRPGWNEMDAVKTQMVLLVSQELLDTRWGQLSAALYLAKVMYPEAMTDVDPAEALRLLSREATGVEAAGIFAYGQELP